MKRFIVGISGASGPVIGIRLVEELLKAGAGVHLVISSQALEIIQYETGLAIKGDSQAETQRLVREHFSTGSEKRLFYYDEKCMEAPIASGSFRTDGMFVAPCSMKTLSAIANGYASNLLERAADVTIKEGGKLILSPRETPFSPIHLENMLKLARIGVTIAPPVAAFYHKPEDLQEMVDFFVGKLLDSADIRHSIFRRWKEQAYDQGHIKGHRDLL
ncbi:MAG: UbiX family flavin prenyltransferase [Nitrospiraceae bacterium]|nr:UbiX family flavin prenyltransferase [Nitrospiraceae bacterium]